MKILVALKREERKLEKHVTKFQHQLNGIRAAMKALGHTAEKEVTKVGRKVRKMSAAGRRKIAAAQKKRWAKVRAQAKKVAK